VVVVFNGVPEPEEVAPQPREAGYQLLFIGNLSERKGVSDLLHALQDHRFADVPLVLTLAGGGDIDRYKALAAQLRVDGKVRFLGWTNKATLDRLLAAADALVLPSYHEGLPLAILEALARGVPVVCTPVGEIAEVLADGHTALFVQPGDRQGLASALLRVLQEPPLRARLRRAGRAVYEAHFSLQRFAAAIARVHHLYFGFHAFGL
jgi:glycosyltransferase involved in cell wall biosynthesis